MKTNHVPRGLKWSGHVLQLFAALLLTAVLVGYGYLALMLLFSLSRSAHFTHNDLLQTGGVLLVTVVTHISAQLMVSIADYLHGKKAGMTEKEILTEMLWLAARDLSMVVLGFATITFIFSLITEKWLLLASASVVLIGSGLSWFWGDRQMNSMGKEKDELPHSNNIYL